MKQLKITALFIVSCIMLTACPNHEEGHRYITFKNNSDKKVTCQIYWSGRISLADSLFQCNIVSIFGVSSDSSYALEATSRHGYWEDDFKTIPFLQLLVMDESNFRKYISEPCDTIRKYVPVLHRYRLKLEDLQKMNWTVEYPPKE